MKINNREKKIKLRKISIKIAEEVHQLLVETLNKSDIEEEYRGHVLLDTIILLLAKNTAAMSQGMYSPTVKEALDSLVSYINDTFLQALNDLLSMNNIDINAPSSYNCIDKDCKAHNNKTVQ